MYRVSFIEYRGLCVRSSRGECQWPNWLSLHYFSVAATFQRCWQICCVSAWSVAIAVSLAPTVLGACAKAAQINKASKTCSQPCARGCRCMCVSVSCGHSSVCFKLGALSLFLSLWSLALSGHFSHQFMTAKQTICAKQNSIIKAFVVLVPSRGCCCCCCCGVLRCGGVNCAGVNCEHCGVGCIGKWAVVVGSHWAQWCVVCLCNSEM